MNKLILFGAGKNGREALKKYGKNKVAFFCDNDIEKQGTFIDGIEVLSFERMKELYKNDSTYIIMITPYNNVFLIGQLEMEGILEYLLYSKREDRFFIRSKELAEEKYKKENNKLKELVKISTTKDLLEDISEFKKVSKEAIRLYKEEKMVLVHHGFCSEGRYYGNLHSLIRYAGISEEEICYFPEVSHNAVEPIWSSSFQYKTAVVMSGTYYRKKIHERYPYVPVFSVGPFIHYAKGIYSKDKINEIKKKYGKILLAFLPHTIESVERLYNSKKFIDDILRKYKEVYESIWLCVYWADVNNSICEYAEEKGIHVVSAGFRFDDKFDCRLKSIFEIADAIVCGDLGTFVNYAIYMDKPIGRIDTKCITAIGKEHFFSLEEKVEYGEVDDILFREQFYRFIDNNIKKTEEQKQWMNCMAGFDQIRSKEYIRNIFQISKDIVCLSEGDLCKYPLAVREMYSRYEKNNDFNKRLILKSAVGGFVDYI